MRPYNIKFKVFFIILLLIFLSCRESYSEEDKYLYYQGVRAARCGEEDSAFMFFDMLLKSHAKSRFFENALFAAGEYYFSISDFYDANESFSQLLHKYPDSKAKPFAFAYLAKIARKRGREDLAKDFEKEVIRFKQSGFLFRESEEHKYTSAFSKKYKAIYFIDRIEIYINNELFAKISF